jgi:hypothetical protein
VETTGDEIGKESIMAKRIQAVTAYRPRIDQGKAATEERFMELVTQRTTLSSGVVKNVQDSEVEALIGLLLDTRSTLALPSIPSASAWTASTRSTSGPTNASSGP